MSERYRKTESELLQMPGAPADQNIRMKQKIIDFDERLGRLIVEEPTVIPVCYAGHAIRHVSEMRGRCKCTLEICQFCPDLVCERCGQLLCRPCAFVCGDRVICRSHGFLAMLALKLQVDSSPPGQVSRPPSRPQLPPRQIRGANVRG